MNVVFGTILVVTAKLLRQLLRRKSIVMNITFDCTIFLCLLGLTLGCRRALDILDDRSGVKHNEAAVRSDTRRSRKMIPSDQGLILHFLTFEKEKRIDFFFF